MPVVEQLEQADGVTIERLEVWHNEANKARMEALRSLYERECGGNMVVPSFYDEDSNRLLCNPGSYKVLKEWVVGSA